MSLYKESEKAISSINEITSSMKSTKRRIDATAESLTSALDKFHSTCKPIYDFADRNINVQKEIEKFVILTREDTAKTRSYLISEIKSVIDKNEALHKKSEIDSGALKSELTAILGEMARDNNKLREELSEAQEQHVKSTSKLLDFTLSLIVLSVINMGAVLAIAYKFLTNS